MVLDPNSVRAGYAAATRKMTLELRQFQEESALAFFELRRELDQALGQVRETQLEFLNYKQAVVHDRARLAEIAYQRMLVQAQIAQREPDQLLQ